LRQPGRRRRLSRPPTGEPTVIKWRRQYAQSGLAGLEDAPRPGGPKTVLTDDVVCEILATTVTPPPESLQAAGVTHWSSRRLAGWLHRAKGISVSHDSISVLWRKFCLQPHRTEGFKFSTDPQLEAKVRDVVGLYLAPPENAVVVCVDEKTQTRPWTGPGRSCRCAQASPSGRRTTTSATEPPCSQPWRQPPARSLTPATPATATASSCAS